jgi:hypothetical protein
MIVLFWRLLIVAPLLSSAHVLAAETPVAILAGRWTYDRAKSRPIDPDLRITTGASGTLHAEGGSSGPYDFDLKGGSHSLSNGRTIAWMPTAPDAWQVTKKRKDEVLETIAVRVAGDTLYTATRGKLPDGSPYERTMTYRRTGRGKGLIGRWRSIKVDTGATWDGLVISTSDDGAVTWRIPTDLQVIQGPFDGSDLPIAGPDGPTGTTIAVRVLGPRRFAYVITNGGPISERGTITISRDGRWLTELTAPVDHSDRQSRLVYKREP